MAEAWKDHPFPNTADILASDPQVKFGQFVTGTWKSKNRQLIHQRKSWKNQTRGQRGTTLPNALETILQGAGDEEEWVCKAESRCSYTGRIVLYGAGTSFFFTILRFVLSLVAS